MVSTQAFLRKSFSMCLKRMRKRFISGVLTKLVLVVNTQTCHSRRLQACACGAQAFLLQNVDGEHSSLGVLKCFEHAPVVDIRASFFSIVFQFALVIRTDLRGIDVTPDGFELILKTRRASSVSNVPFCSAPTLPTKTIFVPQHWLNRCTFEVSLEFKGPDQRLCSTSVSPLQPCNQ